MKFAAKIWMLLLLVTLTGTVMQAQVYDNNWFRLKPVQIGFYRGVNLLDVSRNGFGGDKKRLQSTKGLNIRMPFLPHFLIEAGACIEDDCCNEEAKKDQINNYNQSLSFPLSLQYYVLPQRCKVQPYFGVGTIFCSRFKNHEPFLNENGMANISTPGTKYISILFTQGITFEINTKINLTESLHFYNVDGVNTVGINLGVGFKIP